MAASEMQYGINEYEALADLCERSYFDFFREFSEVFIEEKVIYNWHIKYLCNKLQETMERVIRWKRRKADLIINIPPGETKSSIFSVGLCPWMWTRMKRFKMISVTHTDLLGKDLSMKARDIVLSEKYQKCWPHLALREDANTVGKWNNNFGGWRLSVTVGGRTPTGFHAHTIVIDDPIDPEQAKSTAVIKQATEYCRRTVPSRRTSTTKTPTILIMQRLDNDDPSGDRLRNKEAGPVDHYCLPCDSSWPIKPPELKKRYLKRNGLLDRKRLPKQALKSLRATMGNFGYAGQYGQSPLPKGGLIFDVSQLEQRIGNPPPLGEFSKLVRYWDKAYSEASGAYTCGVLLGVLNLGKINKYKRDLLPVGLTSDYSQTIYWVLDIQRFQLESHRRETRIRQTAERDGPRVKIVVEQEPSAGKESVQNTIRNLAGFTVVADRRGGSSDSNKVVRADPYATQVNAGNVWLKEGPWNDDYLDELRYFSDKAKYKDQVDASSGAFNAVMSNSRVGGWR